MPRIEVAGDICLRRPRPTQGCRAAAAAADDGGGGGGVCLYLCLSYPACKLHLFCTV